MPRRYPVEFWRKVLDLAESGRPVAEVGVTAQSVYNWRNQKTRLRACTGWATVLRV